MREFHRCYEQHIDALTADMLKVVGTLPHLSKLLAHVPKAQMDEQGKASRALMRRAIIDGDWAPLLANQEEQGAQYAGMGIPFKEWFDLVSSLQKSLVPIMVDELRAEPPKLSAALIAMNIYLDIGMSTIADAYLRTKEKIISSQRVSIEELSTPVLVIAPRLLLVPLVGLLDTDRARRLTEQLLHAVRTHRARAVVIDITGVPAVDSKVANHIFQTVAAARLMGARSIVTGLTADVAQALVALGVDVDRLNTAGDLREGLEEAQRMLGQSLLGGDVRAAE